MTTIHIPAQQWTRTSECPAFDTTFEVKAGDYEVVTVEYHAGYPFSAVCVDAAQVRETPAALLGGMPVGWTKEVGKPTQVLIPLKDLTK
jgi:hypothetical protein